MPSPGRAIRADDEVEPVRLITLDPGHFHAALVQKRMYGDAVAPIVHVYAPPGPDVDDHRRRIDGFNGRSESPTHWEERVYTGDDFLQRLLRERPGNVVVISGKNRRKAEYINACAEAGLHVLADKPMCIDAEGLATLREAFDAAERNGSLIYDVMTERSEITTILQKELMHREAVFGQLLPGSLDEPAVVKHSVHHFFKHVAGNPIKRPVWYFDTTQQGEGIVDVTTHLVDLVMWECFPEQIIDAQRDITMLRAKRWPTMITREQYEHVTRQPEFPEFLLDELNVHSVLPCHANGTMEYTIRGVHARVTVEWAFQAPEGAGDTHYSIMRGSRANIVIRQGKEEHYRPELYVEPTGNVDADALEAALRDAIAELQSRYAGIAYVPTESGWRITIPDTLRVGHEAHFAQVMERFLKYQAAGELPEWEVPNMLTKYATTTMALKKASEP
ncbi:MAG: Gfo/Idh/MocA family oxidoreductase [Phycisphaerales bacterium]|nr:Gfo/Idh/MocA family oxidoreductase [Phycisphaerales bacterium]